MMPDLKISDAALEGLRHKTLLIDCDILIDAAKSPDEFGAFFNKIRSYECDIATVDIVRLEFLAEKDVKRFRDLKKFFEATVASVIKMNGIKGVDSISLVIAFNRQAKKYSPADLLLTAALYNFGSRARLLTGNHTDFTTDLFDREHIITSEHTDSIRNYGIYSFSMGKYIVTLDRLISETSGK